MRGCAVHNRAFQERLQDQKLKHKTAWRWDTTTVKEALHEAAAELGAQKVNIVLPESLVTSGKCQDCGIEWEVFRSHSTFTILQGANSIQCPQCRSSNFVPDSEYGVITALRDDLPFVHRPFNEIGIRFLDVLEFVPIDEEEYTSSYFAIDGDGELLREGIQTVDTFSREIHARAKPK
jgi:hypothetical protein